jgi:predicted Na+-dependent transporter
MFAVGVNLSLDDFKHAFQRPGVIALGYVGQFALKPLIGYALAHSLVPSLGLPEAIGKANYPYHRLRPMFIYVQFFGWAA